MTKQHQQIVRQFIAFKDRSESVKKKFESITLAGLQTALLEPVMEAQYALDQKHPLNIYRGLVPYIREHHRIDKIDLEIDNERLREQIEVKDQLIKQIRSELNNIISW